MYSKYSVSKVLWFSFLCLAPIVVSAQRPDPDQKIEHKIDSLLKIMTLDEKIGQLQQMNNPTKRTGPVVTSISNDKFKERIKTEKYGSLLNAWGAGLTREMQEIAVKQTRLGIPMIFGADVIHGFKTIFPIPLAEAASWDLAAAELSARVAATEATAAGLHWTFAPMVDIARDARWGRIAEGSGEDVYLGSLMAKARVRGFQGTDLKATNTLLACAKHFVAYGTAEGGRDYNTTDMSERVLREIYLPPFKAAVDAGVATFMSAFNEFGGVPASGSKYLQTEILRNEWHFKGFVVSDWNSVTEMLPSGHGAAKNKYEAADLAFNAGVDMEMASNAYQTELKNLLADGKVSQTQIDESVRRILRFKYKLGLFEDPYRYSDLKREKEWIYHPKHLEAARDVARKSVVLLKNDKNILPLSKDIPVIAVIGPLADDKSELNGTWALMGEDQKNITLLEGIKAAVGKKTNVLYTKGCNIDSTEATFDKALALASQADVLIVNLGESKGMSGEGASRQSLDLPGAQNALLAALAATGKPIVLILTNGRPLVLTEVEKKATALVESWFLGTQTGHALADILFGSYNPSGKLPVSFPYSLGQVPVYYSHKNTGRPDVGRRGYNSSYLDGPNSPLYPFGFGLSYTTFEYSDISLNKDSITTTDTLIVTAAIKNTGTRPGKETVQLYLRDLYAYGVGRPVKELKAYTQVLLKPGESKKVSFKITAADLSFYRYDMTWGTEPGHFKVFLGGNSRDVKEKEFGLIGK